VINIREDKASYLSIIGPIASLIAVAMVLSTQYMRKSVCINSSKIYQPTASSYVTDDGYLLVRKTGLQLGHIVVIIVVIIIIITISLLL